MAITKTKFLEYTRCPRYPFLANLNYEILKGNITTEELEQERQNDHLKELLASMIEVDENGILIDQTKK